MTEQQPLPPAVLANADAYRTAIGIARLQLLNDRRAIGTLWANMTTNEQLEATLAMGVLVNELVAGMYAEDFPGGVPILMLVRHHDTYLARLAGAFNQTAPSRENPQ